MCKRSLIDCDYPCQPWDPIVLSIGTWFDFTNVSLSGDNHSCHSCRHDDVVYTVGVRFCCRLLVEVIVIIVVYRIKWGRCVGLIISLTPWCMPSLQAFFVTFDDSTSVASFQAMPWEKHHWLDAQITLCVFLVVILRSMGHCPLFMVIVRLLPCGFC